MASDPDLQRSAGPAALRRCRHYEGCPRVGVQMQVAQFGETIEQSVRKATKPGPVQMQSLQIGQSVEHVVGKLSQVVVGRPQVFQTS